MPLVALSLVAILSFAALSIDLGALYEAKAEAQRAADAAALAAAQIISPKALPPIPRTAPEIGASSAEVPAVMPRWQPRISPIRT